MSKEKLLKLRERYERQYKNGSDDTPRQVTAWMTAKAGMEIIDALLEDDA